MNDDITKAIVRDIKETIRKSIDEDYTQYKEKCLKDLEYTLEAKRNKTVSAILDGIDVSIMSKQPYSLEPIIQIRIEKKIMIKGD